MIQAAVRAQSFLRQDPLRAAEVTQKLFPPIEAEPMGQILTRDAEFYQPSISTEKAGIALLKPLDCSRLRFRTSRLSRQNSEAYRPNED
jgi:hypothetical protein